MEINQLPEEFMAAAPIIETIEDAGYEAYFVGGSVRDTLLGLPIHDVDIATSAYPQEIKGLFNRTVDTGIEHGTVMILDHGNGYETTTFRTESGYQDYRRPDAVTFVRSLHEDLKRRDFTINALAMTIDGQVIDYFDGLSDLQRQVIRAVGRPDERFNEDALRTMRAVRFASQLDFEIEPETVAAINHHGELLAKIAVERIHVEFVKLFMGKNPARGLATFIDTNLYHYCPGLNDAKQVLTTLLPKLTTGLTSEAVVWTLLAASLKLTPKAVGHFLRGWKTANQLINEVTAAYQCLEAIQKNEVTDWVLYKAGPAAIVVAAEVAKCLATPSPNNETLQHRYQQLPIKSKKQLAISGKELMGAGFKPGPQLGEILANIERRVVTGELPNDTETLLTFVTASN